MSDFLIGKLMDLGYTHFVVAHLDYLRNISEKNKLRCVEYIQKTPILEAYKKIDSY